ncbi:MAG: hypothetical protein H6704_11170 [Myxococcales bacterium]|nr:hypothetical protein [Myxococcales bacterium]MCB9536802.1 hypothetical protein [Myxococcales bacterium]
MRRFLLTLSLCLVPALALAKPPAGPYEVLPTGDGAFTVSKDGGKTQVGGVYLTEGAAKAKANQLNREAKKDAKKDDAPITPGGDK